MTGRGGLLAARIGRFGLDRRGASAVEFAIVAAPFLYMVMGVLQVGVYYMVQSALDAAVVRTADGLRNSFAGSTTPTMPSGTTLKGTVATNAGALIQNDSRLAVEIRQLASLGAASVPIADGYADYGGTTSALVLRAKAIVTTFAPGFAGLAVANSSAIVRREGR